MGVYVNGMEMPKHCIDCPLKNDEDDCIVQELQHWKDWDDMKVGCPLVEVQTPHGRLIDADELFNSIAEKEILLSFDHSGLYVDISEMNYVFKHIETVVEAEDE